MIDDIHLQINLLGKIAQIVSTGGDANEGFRLNFTISSVYPPNRVHQAFAEWLKGTEITWIYPGRTLWRIDLDALANRLPHLKKHPWIRGQVSIEPDIIPMPREGLAGLRPETRVLLTILRQETVLSQQSRIFLSHKSANKPMVRRFYDVLIQLGFQPWLDEEDGTAGDNLHRLLLAGMKASCAAVFFITPDFKDEKYLAHEIELAMQEATERGDRFRIITLSLGDETGVRGVVPDLLRAKLFKEPKSELEALQEILKALPLRVGTTEWRN